jgi:hypothetical protein
MRFLIQRKGKKAKISLHKDIYSLDSIKKTFGPKTSIGQDQNYWTIEMDFSLNKDIMQFYNYLLYLSRKQ